MKATEAIAKLESIVRANGDFEIFVESPKYPVSDIYFCRDEDMICDNWVQIDAPAMRPKCR